MTVIIMTSILNIVQEYFYNNFYRVKHNYAKVFMSQFWDYIIHFCLCSMYLCSIYTCVLYIPVLPEFYIVSFIFISIS